MLRSQSNIFLIAEVWFTVQNGGLETIIHKFRKIDSKSGLIRLHMFAKLYLEVNKPEQRHQSDMSVEISILRH